MNDGWRGQSQPGSPITMTVFSRGRQHKGANSRFAYLPHHLLTGLGLPRADNRSLRCLQKTGVVGLAPERVAVEAVWRGPVAEACEVARRPTARKRQGNKCRAGQSRCVVVGLHRQSALEAGKERGRNTLKATLLRASLSGMSYTSAWSLIPSLALRHPPFFGGRVPESEARKGRGGLTERFQMLMSCVKVEVAVLGAPSLIVRAVFVDVEQH